MHIPSIARFMLFVAVAALPSACKDSTSPNAGDLVVELSTSGVDLDPDGYLLTVDGGPLRLVQPNSKIRITGLDPGEHVLRIEGQLSSCTIEGANPRTVVTSGSSQTTARFSVTCAARFGYIDAIASITGPDRDGDGFKITVEVPGGERLVANGTMSFGPLIPGSYQAVLGGLARNCTVPGDTVRTVMVVAGVRTPLDFAITCTAFAVLRVFAVTTGPDLDPGGYQVSLTRQADSLVGYLEPNGSADLDSLAAGTYTVTLSDVATNCDVASNPRTITILAGGTTLTTFSIACVTARVLAYAGDVFNGNNRSTDLFSIKSNGTALLQLTSNQFEDGFPSWSPNGARLAFSSNRSPNFNTDVYVMNADGSNVVRLTTADSADSDPSWSPDGTRIAFASRRDGNAEIYVMNADGGSPARLTTNAGVDADPAWSPDGSRIAFRSAREGNEEIYTMTPAGTGVARVTRNAGEDGQPAWSPDGARLAFSRRQGNLANIVVSNADGSGEVTLTSSENESEPAWSPDGSRIAYTGTYCYYYCSAVIKAMRPDGSGRTVITYNSSFSSAWRP